MQGIVTLIWWIPNNPNVDSMNCNDLHLPVAPEQRPFDQERIKQMDAYET